MKYIRLIAVVALGLVAALVGLAGPASAADCGTPAVYKTVTAPAVDAVTHTVKVIDVEAKPGTPEVPAVPAVEEVSHMVKVIDVPAVEEVSHMEAGPWWNWAPNHSQGPQDYEPAFPTDERGTWIGPHQNGGPERTEEGTFNVSHGSSGNSSWFHRDPQVKVIDTPAVEEVSHMEKVIDVEAKPAIPAIPAVPAVEEVSHTEVVIDSPAVPATSKQVLVTEATEACPPKVTTKTVKPVVETVQPPADEAPPVLAYTGSSTAPGLLTGLGLLVGGLGLTRLGRRFAR